MIFLNYFFSLFFIPTTVSPTSSPPLPFPPSIPLSTHPPSPFRNGRPPSHGRQQRMPRQVEARPSSSPAPTHQGWAWQTSMGHWFSKTNSRGRDTARSPANRPRQLCNCHAHAKDLGRSHVGFRVIFNLPRSPKFQV